MAATSTPVYGLSSAHLCSHTSPTSSLFQFRPVRVAGASKFSVGFLNTNHNANVKFTVFSKGLKPSGFELCISSGLPNSCTHMTVCSAAAEGDNRSVDGNKGEGGKEGGDVGKEQKLKLVSEAALLRRKAKNLRQRKRRLRLKRKLRKKGSWPPSKMAKLRKV